MRVQTALALVLMTCLAGCGPSGATCGGKTCVANQRCSAEECVTDSPPSLTVDVPLNNAVVTTSTVEISGIAKDDDPSGLTVEVSGDDRSWTPVQLSADGAFSAQVPLPSIDASAGEVAARARDSYGHLVRVPRTLQVDNLPPTCSITSPTDGSLVMASGSVAVTMAASDGSLVLANPMVSTDDGMTFEVASGNGGAFGFPWVVTPENGVSHQLVFRIDDASGHTCEAKAMVTVDNVRPTIAISSPAPGSLLGRPFFAGGGKVSGTAGDGTRALKSVTLDFADGAGARAATVLGTNWSVNVPAPAGDDYLAHLAAAVATDLAGNKATATLAVTVDVKAPALAITSPLSNAKLNLTNFPGGNNAPLAWTLTDGDPQLTIALVLPDGGLLSPPVVPTSPTDNPRSYQATLQAKDRAGNSSTASVSFSVDRVAPTVVTNPSNNTRMVVGDLSADFSEPMIGGSGLNLNPYAAGSWTTGQHYQVSGLAKDAVYTAATGTVTDLHGNPVVPQSLRFHTEPWRPVSGAVLFSGYVQVQGASVDAEGVINVLAVASGGRTDWIRLDPSTGAMKLIDAYPPGDVVGLLVSARTIQSDLTSRRLAGLTYKPVSGDQVRYSINGGPVTTVAGAAQAFIPTPAFAGEGSALAEFGVVAGGFYKRGGRANLAVGLATVDEIHVTDTHWQLVAFNGGGTDSQDFGCYPVGAPITCAASAVKLLGGFSVGTPNAASSNFCAIHGYQGSGVEKTTLFRWQPGCGACAPDINELGNFDQVVADPTNDGIFYGYTQDGLGNYQVKKRVLSSATCAGAISVVSTPLALGQLYGRIVPIRGTAGFITAGPTGEVSFIAP